MSKAADAGEVRFTLSLPTELHRALKVQAAMTGVGMGAIVEGLIRKYLDKKGGGHHAG